MDVGEDAALRDGHAAEELVELLVVAHREGDVPGDDGLMRDFLLSRKPCCPAVGASPNAAIHDFKGSCRLEPAVAQF